MIKNLRTLRESLSMTQKEFAASLGIGLSTYNGYEIGSREPKSDFLIRVAQQYGVTIDYLMGYTANPDSMSFSQKLNYMYSSEALQIARQYDTLDGFGKDAIKALLSIECSRCSAISKTNSIKIGFKVSQQSASAGTGTYLGPDGFDEIQVDPDRVTGADFGVPVQGDSMEPRFHNGDIILISMAQQVEVGDIALVTMDGCGYVKKIGQDELLSLNKKYAPIPMTEDVRINGKVIGVLPCEG